jgi:hypothetical protein
VKFYDEIPDELLEFTPPPGTLVKRTTWWKDRIGKVLRSGKNDKAEVTIYSIDTNKNGDLFVTMRVTYNNLEPTDQALYAKTLIRGVDNLGAQYEMKKRAQLQSRGSQQGVYYVAWLAREEGTSQAIPQVTTITFKLFSNDDRKITIMNLPIPPRQQAEYLIEASVEKVQY